ESSSSVEKRNGGVQTTRSPSMDCFMPQPSISRTISSYESPPQSTKISKEVDFHPRGEPRSWQTHLPGRDTNARQRQVGEQQKSNRGAGSGQAPVRPPHPPPRL